MKKINKKASKNFKRENYCSSCQDGIFDETWGCYKCKLYQRRISENDRAYCRDYKKK